MNKPNRAWAERSAEEYGLLVPRPDIGVEIIEEIHDSSDPVPERVGKLTALLKGLAPGTWMMYGHPTTNTPKLQALGHPGYRDIAAGRTAALQTWTGPAVIDGVEVRADELTNYRGLGQQMSLPNHRRVQ